jgi:hypothetical protein
MMQDKEKQIEAMQVALETYTTNGSQAKLYFSSMKEISLWLQEEAKKIVS